MMIEGVGSITCRFMTWRHFYGGSLPSFSESPTFCMRKSSCAALTQQDSLERLRDMAFAVFVLIED
jgi:hypothetical protein